MSKTSERKAIYSLLRELKQNSEMGLSDSTSETTPAMERVPAVQAANAKFPPLSSRELDEHLGYETSPRRNFGEKALYLKPNRELKDAATLLWCKWDLTGTLCAFWFYLGIWNKDGQFVGYRFEMPEEGDNHNYFHSQPVRSLGLRENKIDGALQVPERHPSWPLAANSAVELLLCVLISMYGMDGLNKLKKAMEEKATNRADDELNKAFECMERLRLRQPPFRTDLTNR